ncbi:MAG: anti-sigma factor family protein, partial [Candidatus Kapaibacteriales bacterium]
MRIDELINKYLDGDLTPEADAEFRDLLSKDPLATDHFHSMLLLHSILKDDSESIQLPSDFQDKVEGRLLVSYLKLMPNSQNRYHQIKKILSFPVVLIILFILFVLDIHDGKFSNSNSIFISELSKQEDLLRNLLQSLPQNEDNKEFFSTSKSLAFQSKNTFRADINIPIDQTKPDFSNQYNSFFSNLNLNSSKVLLKSEVATSSQEQAFVNGGVSFSLSSNDKFYLQATPSRIHSFYFAQTIFNRNPYRTEVFTSGVHFSSFASKDLFAFGKENIRNKGFANFTQSIGYSISEQLRLGIEFGYTELAFDQHTEILITSSLEAPKVKLYEVNKKKDFANNETLAIESSSEGNDGNFVHVPIDVNFSQQLIWGGIFLEYLISLNEFINVVCRASVGSIDNGIYGSTKFFTEIVPINGISLILGTESNSMWLQVPISSKLAVRTSLGLLYG